MTQRGTVQFAITRPEDIADPYPVYRRFREVDPVHAVPAAAPGSPDTFYVFRYDDVARVLSSRHYGRSATVARSGLAAAAPVVPADYQVLREVVDNWLVFLDPPRHTRLRSLVVKQFSAKVVNDLRPRIVEIADALLADMRTASHADLVADYAAPLPILVVSELLGVAGEHRGWVRDCAVALQEANSSRAGGGPGRYAAADAAARQLDDYFRGEVRQRRRHPVDDVTSLLVWSGDGGDPLTDEEIVGTCIHLLTAGHETTTNLISKSVLALLAHPDALEELRTTPQLMTNAVGELIRYDSPVQMITRWAYRDEVIADRPVPRGSKVVLVLGSANRDPLRFPDPDRLDIRRNTGRHCGFGMGIHYCLGAGLARLEAEIGMTALLRGLPGLAPGEEPVCYAEDLVFHGPTRLVVRTGVGA
ncbi:cytochrome P450 [Pseudonocardia acidicola]|uniref:Cytochrome P450 n=1 Tax=Pseudonocardia acidicola TaxID=2724939 RepID=A0ABX1SHV4_9PSEU|nr:cytochrome P450 [Pseudonocardia acidicola]NMH99976.1 cytochrome P450 [Pseudonocardia acidicola]